MMRDLKGMNILLLSLAEEAERLVLDIEREDIAELVESQRLHYYR